MKNRNLFILLCFFGIVAVFIAAFSGIPVLPVHVMAAVGSYFFFILCVIGCIGMAVSRKLPPMFAIAACETGIIFASLAMGIGAWWAERAWGTFWVWEPRLSGMLLMTLFFCAWRLAVAILGKQAVSDRKLTASLIILGLPAMAFTHLSVRLFGGIHPVQIAQVQAEHGQAWQIWLMAAGLLCLSIGFMQWRVRMTRK